MILKKHKGILAISIIVIISFIIRYQFRYFLSQDMTIYLLKWYRELSMLSLKEALSNQIGNYNMLYQMIIFLMTKTSIPPVYLYKLISIFFDYMLAFGVYVWLKDLCNERKAICGFAVILFLPTIWMNSSVWGQCDSIYCCFIIWSLYYLQKGRINLSFILLGLSFAFKLQSIFIIPFYGYLFLHSLINKEKKISIFQLLIIPSTFLLTSLPNVLAGRKITDIFSIYYHQTDMYHYMYLNYPSIWSLFRFNYDTDLMWAIFITFVLLCSIMYLFFKKKADIWGKHYLFGAFILSYCCVLFLPAMHERYGYLYAVLGIILWIYYGRGYVISVIIELITLKTYLYYLNKTALNIELLSVINALTFLFTLYVFYREITDNPISPCLFDRISTIGVQNEEKCSSKKTFRLIVHKNDVIGIIVLCFAFLTFGSMRLGSMAAPETTMEVGRETTSEIDISFDTIRNVDSVYIYQIINKDVNVNVYAANNGKWDNVAENQTISGTFSWSKVPVSAQTHQIALIFPGANAEIGEIICIDDNGQVIPITNGSDYPNLFDEQNSLSNLPSAYDQTIFDEIYHGRTAYEYIHGMPIFENTHPPLGKSIISVGIRLFGMNPFGYRIMSLIFGTFLIPFLYFFALRITGKSQYAILSGVLCATEFMHYTLSRIATIDIFVAFFVVALFYFLFAFLQEGKYKYLMLSGLSFSLGAATKWTALYATIGISIILLTWLINNFKDNQTLHNTKRVILVCFAFYIALPAIIYSLSYIPFAQIYTDKSIIEHAVSNSIEMLNYHRNAFAEHPYASKWYTWIFDYVPLVDYRRDVGQYRSTIATFVNPIVCYLGLLSCIHNLYLSFFKRNTVSRILIVMYFNMLVPWIFISRTVFIYQYYICTNVLILMIIHSVNELRYKNEKKIIVMIGALSTTLFLLYFPVISGLEAKVSYITEVLTILPKWRF